MNVLFLLGNLYPYSSANAECVKNVSASLSEKKIDVHFLSFGEKNLILRDDNYHTVKAFRYLGNSLYRGEKNGLTRKMYLACCNMFEPPFPLYSKCLKNEFYSMLKKLYAIYRFQKIISVIQPIEAALAVADFKEDYPEIQMIVYEVDSITDDPIYDSGWRKLYKKKSLRIEKKIYDCADLVIHIDSHEQYFNDRYYDRWRNKFKISGLPMISSKYSVDCINNVTSIYEVAYTGSLSEKWRSPQYFYKLIKNISEIQLHVTFCSRGCDEMLQKMQQESPENITARGYVGVEEVIKLYKSSHLLLSIGNEGTNILPSKIYQYISSGLPIIHIASNNDDVCIPILNKYGNCVIINKQKTLYDNKRELLGFINSGLNLKRFDNIVNAFVENTPEYVGNMIISN